MMSNVPHMGGSRDIFFLGFEFSPKFFFLKKMCTWYKVAEPGDQGENQPEIYPELRMT